MFNNVKLGIAPIGWTNDDMPQLGGKLTFEQMVSEAALAGFQGTEVGGKFPSDPAELGKALDLRGLKIASQWFSSFLCSTPYGGEFRSKYPIAKRSLSIFRLIIISLFIYGSRNIIFYLINFHIVRKCSAYISMP